MHKPWEVPVGVLPGELIFILVVCIISSLNVHAFRVERERKPHLMHQIFMQRIQKREATEFAMKTYKVVKAIESEVQSMIDPEFESPLNEIRLLRWAEIACKKKEQSVLGSTAAVIFKLLEVWYVALRMICQSWEVRMFY